MGLAGTGNPDLVLAEEISYCLLAGKFQNLVFSVALILPCSCGNHWILFCSVQDQIGSKKDCWEFMIKCLVQNLVAIPKVLLLMDLESKQGNLPFHASDTGESEGSDSDTGLYIQKV